MAARTRQLVETVAGRFASLDSHGSVAIGAGHGSVCTVDRELGFLVARQAIGRGTETADLVAGVTAPSEFLGGELAAVPVAMALPAALMGHSISHSGWVWPVALCALYLQVFAFEWVGRSLVFGHAEQRWLEALFVVARGAIAAAGAGPELSLMRVVRVAVAALCVRHRPAELQTGVALAAADRSVLAREWELRLRVVEPPARPRHLPAGGCVAGFAGLREGAFVRIFVAGLAPLHRDSVVLRIRPWSRRRLMTFRALSLLMSSGERETGRVVIKQRRVLPAVLGMTRRAVFAQLSAVLIGVATETVGGQAQQRPPRVLDLNPGEFGGRNVLGVVALRALQRGVFSLERVTGFPMIETGAAVGEIEDFVIAAIVLQVAADAIPAFFRQLRLPRVVAAPLLEPLANNLVATTALEARFRYPKLVALRTVTRPVKLGMRLGELTG